MARGPKNLDEWIAAAQKAGVEIDEDLLEELREVATPKGARDRIAQLEKQLKDAEPLIDLGRQTQRAPEIEKAFAGFQTDNLAPAVKKAMASFDGLSDPNKVNEFASEWGLQPKPAEQQQNEASAAQQVVGATTAPTPGTPPGKLGDPHLLQQELREAEARGASQAEQAQIMVNHGLEVTRGGQPIAAPAPAAPAPATQ